MADLPSSKTSFLSPIGWVEVIGSASGISSIVFRESDTGSDTLVDACVGEAVEQLQAYFEGTRKVFDLHLDSRGTEFQQKVWQLLQEIPFGQTRSYMDQAHAFGNEKAIRAVGTANGRNPISIVIPCHRVIGSNGSLTGYAGGLHRKQWLLRHESNLTHGQQTSLFE